MLIFNFDFISWLFLLKKCWFYYVQNVFLVLLPKPIISIWQHSTLCETIGPKYGPRFIHVSEVISPFFSAALISTLSWKLFFCSKIMFLWCSRVRNKRRFILDCFPGSRVLLKRNTSIIFWIFDIFLSLDCYNYYNVYSKRYVYLFCQTLRLLHLLRLFRNLE